MCCMQCCAYPGPQVTAAWRDMSSWFFAGSTSSSRGFLNTGSLQNHTHSYTHTHKYIQAGTHRHTGTQAHRLTYTLIHRYTQTHSHIGTETESYTQTHTDTQIHPHNTHSLTHSVIIIPHSHVHTQSHTFTHMVSHTHHSRCHTHTPSHTHMPVCTQSLWAVSCFDCPQRHRDLGYEKEGLEPTWPSPGKLIGGKWL